jgi:hypothetical protein
MQAVSGALPCWDAQALAVQGATGHECSVSASAPRRQRVGICVAPPACRHLRRAASASASAPRRQRVGI